MRGILAASAMVGLAVWVLYSTGALFPAVAFVLLGCFLLCLHRMGQTVAAPRYDHVEAHSWALGVLASGTTLTVLVWLWLHVGIAV